MTMLFRSKEDRRTLKQQFYSAALYLRLSRDDYGVGDSGSIKTQQMLLERYCQEQHLHIHDRYIDDGYSGLNFERPAFLRMLEDIRRGQVNLVVTKDLSRLGRDYIQTGYYTELFFPQHNVRYVALSDGVDTLHDNNDIAPFKNILNDMYAKDLSRKVKSAKRARAAQGAFTGSHPPYGYRQQADNCNLLVINEETAPVVREIFRMARDGLGAVSIAKWLREQQILTPAAYKVQQGERHFAHLFADAADERQYRWAYTTVHRMLSDVVYLGHMVGHKSQVDSYKTKQRSLVPKEEQLVVKNTHPPLVSQEDFDKVQLLIHARHFPRNDQTVNLFQALLYCNECGHRLSMATKKQRGQEIRYFRCMHHYHFPKECTGTHFIRYDQVYRIVLEDVQRIGELLTCRMDEMVKLLSAPSDSAARRLQERETKLQNRLTITDSIVEQLYEDFAAGKTTAMNFNRLLLRYQEEQTQIQTQLRELSPQIPEKIDRSDQLARLREAVQSHLDIHELDMPLLHELIQRIHVGQRERLDGRWIQDIRIEYRFAGELPKPPE